MISWNLRLVILAAATAATASLAAANYVQGHDVNSAYPHEPIPLSRCERSIPIVHLIPATMFSSVPSTFFQPLMHPYRSLAPLKRPTRQQQSAVVQQVIVNQNAGHGHGPPPPRFGFGHGGHGGHGFGGFGHRPHSFGSHHPFFGRTSQEPEAPITPTYSKPKPCGSTTQIQAPPCPKSYLFSCQPKLVPVNCAKGSPCANNGNYA